MSGSRRLATGVAGLDEHLGGGLLPGTLTVVVGASGIGKTQFGLQFAHAGMDRDARPGIVFDMHARVDSQSHAEYARRMFDWSLVEISAETASDTAGFFDPARDHGSYLHVFRQEGRRVTQRDVDFDTWRDWHAELGEKLVRTIAFFYGNFTLGVRRAVIDGIEPAERPSESIQLELFEYIYHQILRKDCEWVARDLFRQHYRANAAAAAAHRYDRAEIAAVILLTSHETVLDDLVDRPLADGDLLANANTLIYCGKIRDGQRIRRGMHIAKHRGSACSDEILYYRIDDRGLRLD